MNGQSGGVGDQQELQVQREKQGQPEQMELLVQQEQRDQLGRDPLPWVLALV
jgi:hypothetical protein